MRYIVCSSPEHGCFDTIFRKITLIRYGWGGRGMVKPLSREGGFKGSIAGRTTARANPSNEHLTGPQNLPISLFCAGPCRGLLKIADTSRERRR
jgi:hypothetical protein